MDYLKNRWKVGDIAHIECFGPSEDRLGIDGEFCTLRQFIGDKKTARNTIVPNAWLVQIHARGYVDLVPISEYALQPIRDHREKVEWSDGPWQPLEYVRYP